MSGIPGFVDLQVNGFVGIEFAEPALTRAGIETAFRAVLARGTAAFLPTLITSPLDTYRRNIPLLVEVMRSDEFKGRVLGLHLEGPFISSQPGAVGAHDPAYVRPPDVTMLEELIGLGQGLVRLLTVAAEVPGVEALIQLARSRGVTVSIGHSLFSSADLTRVYAAGARALTHLGNGLPNQLPRHPNPMWDGLADDGFTAMVITDGHHLPASVVKTMARAKGAERLIVVSDCVSVAGLPPGEYDVLGNHAILEPSGRFHNPEKQCLVGSSATMTACMNFLASLDVFGFDDLVTVGFHNPLRLLGLTSADVRPDDGVGLVFEAGQFVPMGVP
jgi:N-acetylglucosamine-6-phosphate deacetylase